MTDDNLELRDADPRRVGVRADIVSAHFAPRGPDTLFNNGMSPVNLLPRVFNYQLGTEYPRLPDRRFLVVAAWPYRFMPIPTALVEPED